MGFVCGAAGGSIRLQTAGLYLDTRMFMAPHIGMCGVDLAQLYVPKQG
jgi:hypothetical protein